MLELDVDLAAGLTAALGQHTQAMREAARRDREMNAAVSYLDEIAFPFTSAALPVVLAADLRPKDGFVWAVQRFGVTGLAATDQVTLYRANSASEALGHKALHTFTVTAAGQDSDFWNPARTGVLLKPRQGLAVNGTFTGTLGIVSFDVIQVAEPYLWKFLI